MLKHNLPLLAGHGGVTQWDAAEPHQWDQGLIVPEGGTSDVRAPVIHRSTMQFGVPIIRDSYLPPYSGHGHRMGTSLLRRVLSVLTAGFVILVVVITYRHTGDIDFNSGRLRHRGVVAGLPIWSSESETPFSIMAKPLVDPMVAPDWREFYSEAELNPLACFGGNRRGMVLVVLNEFVKTCHVCEIEGFPPPDRERALQKRPWLPQKRQPPATGSDREGVWGSSLQEDG